MNVTSRRGMPRWPMTRAQATEPTPPAAKTMPRSAALPPRLVLDHVRQQHLRRAHEEQVGDGRRAERSPQPDLAAHEAQALAHVGDHRAARRRAAAARRGDIAGARDGRDDERGRVDRERGADARRARSARRPAPGRACAARSAARTGRASWPAAAPRRAAPRARSRRRRARRRRRPRRRTATSPTMCQSSSAPLARARPAPPPATRARSRRRSSPCAGRRGR